MLRKHFFRYTMRNLHPPQTHTHTHTGPLEMISKLTYTDRRLIYRKSRDLKGLEKMIDALK